MKLKCSSVKEADDWQEALEAESALPVDSSPEQGESPVTEVLVHLLSLTPRVSSLFTDCSISSFRLTFVCYVLPNGMAISVVLVFSADSNQASFVVFRA